VSSNTHAITFRTGRFCTTPRADSVSSSDYLKQLTYLIFSAANAGLTLKGHR